MSWESILTKELLSAPPTYNLSATRLLGSPAGSRYLLTDSNGMIEEDISRIAGYGSSSDGTSLWARQRFNVSRNALMNCLIACHTSLRQYLARRKIERGLRFYEQHNQTAAVRIWRSVLKTTCRREDCFQLLGYLYQAHMDWGKYREAIEFGHRQLGISEELNSPSMRAETYLNLARAHERLGALERALSYARHSLYNECSGSQCRNGGLVHLTVARVYLEMGGFCRALEGLQGAHKIAMSIGDSSLELQVCVVMSELFERLHDNEKCSLYASKAYDLSRSLQLGNLNSTHHRAALLRMACALRKQGELGDAYDYCMEATRLSLMSDDQAAYTRSIRIMGDIYRHKLDIDRAFRQYEIAMGTSAAIGDRMAQMEAMDGAARCLESLRLQQKICNCRPLEFNTRLLEVASSIGAKLLVRKIRDRLGLIYLALGDEEQYNMHARLAKQTDEALGLNCGVCNEILGLEPDSLEALPCSHILHTRCAQDLFRRRDKNTPRACPACNKTLSSRWQLIDVDQIDSAKKSAVYTTNRADILCDEVLSTPEIIANGLTSISNDNIAKCVDPKKYSSSYPSNDNSLCLSPKPLCHSNLSLVSLSLRASSLTIDSDKNVTSSV